MPLESIGYKQSFLWHGRGHRFDPDQVHQQPHQNEPLPDPDPFFLERRRHTQHEVAYQLRVTVCCRTPAPAGTTSSSRVPRSVAPLASTCSASSLLRKNNSCVVPPGASATRVNWRGCRSSRRIFIPPAVLPGGGSALSAVTGKPTSTEGSGTRSSREPFPASL